MTLAIYLFYVLPAILAFGAAKAEFENEFRHVNQIASIIALVGPVGLFAMWQENRLRAGFKFF